MIISNLFNQVELVNIKIIVEIVTFQKLGTDSYFYEIATLRSQ